MPVADDLKVYLRAETRAAVRAMKKAQKQTDSLAGQLGHMAKTATRSFAGYVAAAASIGAVIKTMRESVELYGQQIQAEQKLGAAIRASGGDVDDLLPKYKDLASRIQAVTTEGDESTLALIQQAKSMGVADDKIEEATRGAIGLSKALGIGTQQAIRGVSNALNGEFTTLQRYIPALRTTEDESEKLAIVQKAMADGFEVAKAEADNGYGAMQQLGNSIGDLKEQTGRAITTAMHPFVESLTTWVTKLTEAETAANDLMDALRTKNSGEELSLKEQIILQQQQIENIQSRIAADKANEQVGWGRFKAEKSNTEELDAQLRSAEAMLGNLKRRAQEQKNLNAAEQNSSGGADADAINHLKALKEAYAKTHDGQIAALESQIEYFETFKKGPMAVAVLEMLREKYDQLTASENDSAYAAIDSMTTIQRFARQTTQTVEEENKKRRASVQDYLGVANSMISSFSSLWSNYYQNKIDAAEDGSREEKKLMRDQAMAQKNWASFQAIINTAAAVTKTMTSIAYPFNIPLAAAQGVAGGLQVAAIQSQPLPAFANGADFTTNGPQTIVVGEKGRERVRIDPQPDSRSDGVTVIMNGNVYGPGGAEEFANYVVNAINRGQRAGRVEAFA